MTHKEKALMELIVNGNEQDKIEALYFQNLEILDVLKDIQEELKSIKKAKIVFEKESL